MNKQIKYTQPKRLNGIKIKMACAPAQHKGDNISGN